jgi:GT2 family glycosyltransferase
MPASTPGSEATLARPLTLAVIVPATDDPPTLERVRAALEAGTRKPDQLIVQRGGVGGPAAARNLAAAGTEADVLVFVDSDVEVHGDALELIERRFGEDPDLAALFGAYDDSPADPGLPSRYRNLLHHHVHSGAAGEAETFWAGLGAIRREPFEEAGGFDADRYSQPSVEDIELGMRLRRRGARIALDPQIRGRHLKRWTPLSIARTDFARRGVPWARLLLQEGGSSRALNLGWRRRASAVASVALIASLLGRRRRLAAWALAANLVLDRDLYALLLRRGGPRLLLAGIPLHQLHQLCAAASVPAAVVLHLIDRRRD